jgi:tetratricopeptide (TPR) repeat protein
MSRLDEKLSAIEGTAHVLARTDLPRFHTRRRARHRRSVIALGAVVLLGAAWLAVMLRAPSTPSPSAPPVLPSPSAPPPEPLRAPELRELAREATVLGSLAQAEELLKRAVALDHADASAWSDLGVVLVRRGQHWRGIEAIQRSLALNPKHAEAHRNLAVALDQNGQMFGAAAHYRAFLALAPPEHPDRGQIAERLTFLRTADERR